MNDRMIPISFAETLIWISKEYKQHRTIFGIPEKKFFRSKGMNSKVLFGETCELPIGPAAGPHTQLTQNIICSYLTGARFIELKTVQILDNLEFDKPCIDAEDEGYNTEWSTELSITQAYKEYVKSWFLFHILKEFLGLSPNNVTGFVFNMSVGYDLKGISSPPVDNFIESLKDASNNVFFNECKTILKKNIPEFFPGVDPNIVNNISPRISHSITLSTMHGCPPQEQEAICKYLIEEKNLHTYVKLNPTLLGYEQVSEIFNNLGFTDIKLNPESFSGDIQYPDAVKMIRTLQNTAAKHNLEFGVKLSNTLAVENLKQVLPGKEMYMSGRSLYPLTISLASKLAEEFSGKLKISYAGGTNVFNVKSIIKSGIMPITLATEILKPGGYYRFTQIAESISDTNLFTQNEILDVQLLKDLSNNARKSQFYRKNFRQTESLKLKKNLPMTDCYLPPCQKNCPIDQDVPEYINLIRQSKHSQALRVIYEKNPLPFITGHICDHQCMLKCIRNDYEQPVLIRDLKKAAAEKGFDQFLQEFISPVNSTTSAAVIGAGPCGLATASFLSRAGIKVKVFDILDSPGGMVKHTLPSFRLPETAIVHDLELLRKQGVEFELNCNPEQNPKQLQSDGYKYIVIAIGAWQEKELKLKADPGKVLNAIEFLTEFKKKPDKIKLGRKVAVIGGGNSAMDGARAALRVNGVESVSIIYRRTKIEMPADREEFDNALKDGVNFFDLLQPLNLKNGKIKCQVMKLGKQDKSGRRRPLPSENEFKYIPADKIITAIGERPNTNLLEKWNIKLDNLGKPITDNSFQINQENIYLGGDVRTGPASVVEAIRDARKISDHILAKENLSLPIYHQNDQVLDKNRIEQSLIRKGSLKLKSDPTEVNFDSIEEAERCLDCGLICNKCVEVCPNRANIAIEVPGFDDQLQIIHIDAFCNECGNCETFCPYQGAPYKDKFTYFNEKEFFYQSKNNGFYLEQDKKVIVRLGSQIFELSGNGSQFEASYEQIKEHPELQNIIDIINTIKLRYNYLLKKI